MIAVLILAGLVLLDATQRPSRQISVKLLVAGILAYQKAGFPPAWFGVQCRYQPSCSNYCIEALQRHGVARGSVLCVRRLLSCTSKVPPGTPDPVPR